MSRLILVLRDLHPARLSEAARASLPRLGKLEQWLARGATEQAADGWRLWLQRRSRDAQRYAAPLASIAGAAVANLPAAQPLWLATPLHLVAGLDTVRVHPAGLLELAWEEQQALQQDFKRVFAGSGWSLHPTGRREMLLAGGAGAASGAVRSHDPALWLGADPRSGMPAGPGAEALRRLGAELEMWLHEHPVNQARLGRGLLNANALWIWGGGAAAMAREELSVPDASGATVAWADDLFIDGLARLDGFAVEPLPTRWPQTLPAMPVANILVACELGAAPDERTLRSLERDWIGPALGRLADGGLQSATLLAGSQAVRLERVAFRSLWRRLRRTRPWWETLLQC